MDYCMPGFPILYHLPELAQTHVHWDGDATQTSHPLSSLSPPAFKLYCLPGNSLFNHFPSIRVFHELALFIRWPNIGASTAASVLPMNIQDWFPLGLTDLISLQSKGLSRVFSSTTIWKHQFSSTQPSQLAKNLPAVQETWVQSLGWKHPWRRKWQPTPIFLPGESHGQRSLSGYRPWGCKSRTLLSN